MMSKVTFSTPELIRERSNAYRRQMDSTNPKDQGYTMCNETWPGMAKLIEEAGEVTQVCGKIISVRGSPFYYDGTQLRFPLQEELGDLLAAITYVIDENNLDKSVIRSRVTEKLKKYYNWKELNQ
ncbi:MAG: hypothetical protein EOO61_04860 [Hymenobacter sp.]|nr:MAG: hypothetical protein EOO61_04860 [Hymenobacter sp.]